MEVEGYGVLDLWRRVAGVQMWRYGVPELARRTLELWRHTAGAPA